MCELYANRIGAAALTSSERPGRQVREVRGSRRAPYGKGAEPHTGTWRDQSVGCPTIHASQWKIR